MSTQLDLSGVEPLAPGNRETLQRLLNRPERLPLLAEPCSEERIKILGAFSARILRHLGRPADPALAALAAWLRPAHLQEMLRDYVTPHLQQKNAVLAPAGLVFHVAPANVDTMFVYSWAISFLCGNINVVRLPSQRSPILETLLDLLRAHMEEHRALAEGNAFIGYGHNSELTSALSLQCDQRIVWGGDETVTRIRSIPMSPHASERSFASKYSMALLDAAAFLGAGKEERRGMASRVYADVFPFDQMACSSPQLFFWIGDAERFDEAVTAFDESIAFEIERRRQPLDVGLASHRHNFAFEMAATAQAHLTLGTRGFSSLRFPNCSTLQDRQICGAGTFAHVRVAEAADLSQFIQPRDQTLTHWGIDRGCLRSLASLLGRQGIDRIVPVGQALSFTPVWDGHDLVGDLTRKVSIIC